MRTEKKDSGEEAREERKDVIRQTVRPTVRGEEKMESGKNCKKGGRKRKIASNEIILG